MPGESRARRYKLSKKFTVTFSPNSVARLEKMKELTGTADLISTINNALRVYEWIVLEFGREAKVTARNHDGTISVRPVFEDKS